MKAFTIAFSATTFLIATGCERTSINVATEKETAAPADAVTVKLLDFEGFQKLVASKKGKVVVVDCWSTSCEPCMKEFPGLVKLHNKYPDKLACVSLSFDYEGGDSKPDDVKEKVLKFLTEQKATFDNVIGTLDSDTMMAKVDIVAPPSALIYDRDGKLAKKFSGDFKYDDVEKIVAGLFADK
jgi:thiol-disulfide isomerase/thioredoxin